MSFNPYLHFQGNCRPTMQAYAALFGGDPVVMAYKDAPDGPEAMRGSDLVMHAALTLPDGVLLASDFPPGMDGDPQKAVTINHNVKSFERGQQVFDALAEGGFVLMPYGATFWSKGFGMLKDRFGTHWMISAPH